MIDSPVKNLNKLVGLRQGVSLQFFIETLLQKKKSRIYRVYLTLSLNIPSTTLVLALPSHLLLYFAITCVYFVKIKLS